ncbi:MAG: GNAT family N-acetyltransferase [Subdoligranulum sp.]|nr:GNAT family N-acetyltransferase [Subdoligranulum sp.]MBD5101697.1 GNAT family N-acetyltransferase [Subdoligranulum sp.]
MVRLKIVDPGNWRLGLKVSESQKRFVSDDMRLLARAYAYRENRSNAYVIYDQDVPVGMALYYDCDERKAFDFSQIFIDERYQGKGLGTEAARQILKLMEEDGKYDKVILCYIDGNKAAKNMYETLGFYLTGECDEDEIIMEKILR